MRGFIDETRRGIAPAPHKPAPQEWSDHAVTAAWLGHSTVLVNFLGVRILTDPVLFGRVGADMGLATVGPKRLVAPALRAGELPPIDLVLLSHAHMDHFDLCSLKWFSPGTQAVTARHTGDLLRCTRIRPITELGWGERTRLQTSAGDLEVEAFPVRHWGARWRRDAYRGYNGYVLRRGGRQILFGGDTAFTESFRDLRHKGPFDFAIMPIGAYDPWVQSHCTPEEAVQMSQMAGAEVILPVHHYTFTLGREGQKAPIERLQACLEREPERIALKEIGETYHAA